LEEKKMNKTSEEIDLTILPDSARRELLDFYEFLIRRYGKKGKGKTTRYGRLVSKPLKVSNIVIPLREELHER
jgi:hypothetical protein